MLQVYLKVEERRLVLLPDVTPSPLHSFPLSLHPGGWKSEASFPSLVLTAVLPAGWELFPSSPPLAPCAV